MKGVDIFEALIRFLGFVVALVNVIAILRVSLPAIMYGTSNRQILSGPQGALDGIEIVTGLVLLFGGPFIARFIYRTWRR